MRMLRICLRDETVPEADPEDVRELLNYRDAFEYVSFYSEQRRADNRETHP